MLQLFAHTLLKDLNYAGAVFCSNGEIIETNDAFNSLFVEQQDMGKAVLSFELKNIFKTLCTQSNDAHPAEAQIIYRDNTAYRLDVYYLDKNDSQGVMRLVVITPVDAFPESSNHIDSHCIADTLSPMFGTLIGRDPGFLQALLLAQRAAQTDLPVLILGESGTGKEVLARTIHQASQRHRNPFEDVNCAAIPDSLVESELFGYEKGAFTGASNKGKTGFFENAHRGTIFMDEIGEAAPQTQAKLLRVLESGQFRRIGGTRNISVNVRLISATNQDLRQRIAEGRFRADLLYRINTITIRLSPLRERKDDLPTLAEHFLNRATRDQNKTLRFSKEAMKILASYAWPGNVRELKGVIDYAVTMTAGTVITPLSFPGFLRVEHTTSGQNTQLDTPPVQPAHGTVSPLFRNTEFASFDTPPFLPSEREEPASDLLGAVLEHTEKRHIRKVLESSQTRSEAIRRLGVSRRTFYTKIKQYGLD